jgi:hypothetical protein
LCAAQTEASQRKHDRTDDCACDNADEADHENANREQSPALSPPAALLGEKADPSNALSITRQTFVGRAAGLFSRTRRAGRAVASHQRRSSLLS